MTATPGGAAEADSTDGPAGAAGRARLVSARRLRLATGLVLFAYVSGHLANHALGLVSLEAQEQGRVWFLAVWRNPVGTVLLLGSLVLHLALALKSLYARRRLRMPAWEAAQLVLGLAIPVLLIEHVLGTRMVYELYGIDDTYTYVELVLWTLVPEAGWRQILTVAVAWLHGCIGLHFWLRLKPAYRRLLPVLYAPAILVPVLALLGFVAAGREVSRLAADPGWLDRALGPDRFPGPEAVAAVYGGERAFLWGFGIVLVLILAARLLRAAVARRRGILRIAYPDGRVVDTFPGATLLEISRAAGIPHASVCGGRGRCSTCRVRISKGLETLPPAGEDERRVLERIGAPPSIRLACQIRPRHDLEVTPLLPPTATARDGVSAGAYRQGREREIAILFADLRSFTRIAEHKLPYDVVFILNRYFAAMGEAVESAGGRVDKFIGDGVMALFGLSDPPAAACRQALAAAAAMSRHLDALNEALRHDLDEPLKMGIGIHAGPAIVGEMGYAGTTAVTAVGDAVNTASRLEALTKTYGCELVVSERVAERAGVDLSSLPREETRIRGRKVPLAVRIARDASVLADMLARAEPPPPDAAGRDRPAWPFPRRRRLW